MNFRLRGPIDRHETRFAQLSGHWAKWHGALVTGTVWLLGFPSWYTRPISEPLSHFTLSRTIVHLRSLGKNYIAPGINHKLVFLTALVLLSGCFKIYWLQQFYINSLPCVPKVKALLKR